jgi:hypothetical protein
MKMLPDISGAGFAEYARQPAFKAVGRIRWVTRIARFSGLALSILFAAAAFVPVEERVTCKGIVRPEISEDICLPEDAYVVFVETDPGTVLRKGGAVITFEAPELVRSLAIWQAELDSQKKIVQLKKAEFEVIEKFPFSIEQMAGLAAEPMMRATYDVYSKSEAKLISGHREGGVSDTELLAVESRKLEAEERLKRLSAATEASSAYQSAQLDVKRSALEEAVAELHTINTRVDEMNARLKRLNIVLKPGEFI